MTAVVHSPVMPASPELRHPLGSKARVLLTGVFGPYAQDDHYGSRSINPMELYQNQVTRCQDVFSLRMFHRSWGIMMIQANINAPCALLDFPTRDRFIAEIENVPYDIIGISSIIPNVGKVAEMCRLIRQSQPNATIIVGGHVANLPDLDTRVDADHIVRGEGVRWMRNYLGEDPDAPIHHPKVLSGSGTRSMGMKVDDSAKNTAATVIPSVGCPLGCNFCATSAMFGGKGKFINFYPTGDELFHVMDGIATDMGVQSFFMMDENFLLHRKRALRLLELMEEYDKPWALYVFSSANVLSSYSIDQLVRLGISWVWMGMEGEKSQYAKLNNIDTRTLVRELQSHGVRVLGSSIIGLEEHTPDNIDRAIDYAVSHDTEFHQFMLYTPIPGTPLHREHKADGSLLDEAHVALADTHGQHRFNYKHPHIKDGQETQYLLDAFTRDFEVNGPSILRLARTTLQGWLRYKNHPSPRVRARFKFEARDLPVTYASALWAARNWLKHNAHVTERINVVLRDIYREFGITSRMVAPLAGRYIRAMMKRERKRLKAGRTYEPPTFYERNRFFDPAWMGHGFKPTPCGAIAPVAATN